MLSNKFDKKVLNFKGITCLISIIVVVLCAIGSKNLYFRGDYKVFFEDDNPQRVAYENMQRVFSKNESASIIISAKDGDLFNEKSLALIKTLTDESWQTPLSTRVDSITNFQRTYSLEDDLVVEDLVLEPEWLTPDYIKTVKQVSTTEPDLVNKLISEDGHVAMINITVQLPDGDQTKEITEIGKHLRNLLIPIKQRYPNHEFRLSGIAIMTDAMFIAALKDTITLFPLMFLIITVLLCILLRSIYAAVVTLIIVSLSVVATMGAGGWFGMFINIASVNVPIIITTLAIADSVHIISSTRYYMGAGYSQREAILQSIALNRKAIIMTSVTTAIGFLTLNFAKVPILSDLGNLVAIGVIFACLFSLTLLPALLMMKNLNFAPNNKTNSVTNSKTSNVWLAFSNNIQRHFRFILVAAVGLTILSAHLASQNKLNDIAIEYFNKGNEFRQDADFQQDNLSGLSTIDFAIYTDVEHEINNPNYLQVIEDFTLWLENQPEVDHVLSFANTMKRLNMNMENDAPEAYQLPQEREIAAQYLLLYEMSLPYGLDINNQIDINKSATRIMVTLKNLGSEDFTAFESRAKTWMSTHAPEYKMDAASLPLIFAHIGKANMAGMLQGAIIALVLISGLLLVALKSIKLGLISLIPNLLPALFGFAIWAMISGNISMALSVVLTMTLGIIVDDTVHFLVKYQKAVDSGSSIKESVQFAFENVGNALTITTIVLASGFGVLAFSDFAINSDMGTLTAIIIALALIIDLLILPAVLLLQKDKNIRSEKTA
ncbi:efflux RND transporter permease subunit [Agaribacter marinus]|uniref:RND transporter n=1 Tax=Agaribacter marinus TaxID=1431249 RepID=A0AA37SZJ9_9ALTE|nr:MMPL family transporter [Agaribacter marinus]GLR72127.1 RND transporter [Agaribacter marinus]